MKLRVFTAFAAILAFAACGQRTGTTTHHAAGSQVITVTEEMLREGGSDTVRFGNLASGEVAVKRLTLKNATATPIVIVNHDTGCDCTSLDYDHKPIMADGETELTCTYNSTGTHGWQFKLVKVYLSGADTPLRIFVEADVK